MGLRKVSYMNVYFGLACLLFIGQAMANDQTMKQLPDSLDQSSALELTAEEQQWLNSHPSIRFTGDPDWLPYEAFDDKGNYIGIVSQYLELIEAMLGRKFIRVVSPSWEDSVAMAEDGSVDILSETNDSRLQSILSFTDHYLSSPVIIVMRNTENYTESITKIKSRKIGLIKNYGYTKKIHENYPDINFNDINSVRDGLISVSTGEIDALICTMTMCGYTIYKLGMSNIKITGKTEFETHLSFGVNKKHGTLVSILNKAINNISQAQQQKILDEWIIDKYIEKTDYKSLFQAIAVFCVVLILFLLWNRSMAREITHRKRLEDKLKHQATHDDLTKLPNRKLAKDRLSHEIALARRNKSKAAVLFLDLDGFKLINDTLGHDAGDLVLQATAVRLLSCVREVDTVARIGGDEFLVLLSDVKDKPGVAGLAKRLIKAVGKPLPKKASEATLGVSIGIALYPDHASESESLISSADKAMYDIKRHGKNHYGFSDGLDLKSPK
jgi:diguanylate cyclase (GGDEF)-like protein